MPHHRHPVTAQDEPLNVGKVERGLFCYNRIRSRTLRVGMPEYTPEQSSTFFLLRRLLFIGFSHSISPAKDSFLSLRAIQPMRIPPCDQRSTREYPEHSARDMPDKNRSERG